MAGLIQHATELDRFFTEETFAFVLAAFQKVAILESLTLRVEVAAPNRGFGQLSYDVSCAATIRVVPSVLNLPQLDRASREVNIVDVFLQRGGRTDSEFARALADYFLDVWPAFNDRGHLFGGAGQLKFLRKDVDALLTGAPLIDITAWLKSLY